LNLIPVFYTVATHTPYPAEADRKAGRGKRESGNDQGLASERKIGDGRINKKQGICEEKFWEIST
jgi:hypothetical protein